MQTRVIPIGNSKGVRIPRGLLDLCHIGQAVNLSVKGETIIIRPIKRRPRAGWEVAFKKMHAAGEDKLVLPSHVDAGLESWEW